MHILIHCACEIPNTNLFEANEILDELFISHVCYGMKDGGRMVELKQTDHSSLRSGLDMSDLHCVRQVGN